MNDEEAKQKFLGLIAHEQQTIDAFTDTGARWFEGDGHEPLADKTDALIAESKRRISLYQSLIARIDARR